MRLKRFVYIVGGLSIAGLTVYVAALISPNVTLMISGIAFFALLVMILRPPKLVMRSRLFVLALLIISAIGLGRSVGVLDAADDKRLSDLKMANPNAYVNELKALGRDKKWFAALKEIRPNEYRVELARRNDEAKLDLIRKDEQAGQERLKQLFEDAKGDGRYGLTLRKADYEKIWNLSVSEGRLHCKQGPLYEGKPRPLILFDAGAVTYGVNGTAMGWGKYKKLRTISTQDATQTATALITDHLISAGALMCRATLEEECGSKYGAILAAEKFVGRRLKAPKTAEFASNETQAAMIGCGEWQVSSYVDAQNGFGVMIRTQFTVSVTKSSNAGWNLADLKMSQ